MISCPYYPNPPFNILLCSLGRCRHFCFANCLPVRLYQEGTLEGDRKAGRGRGTERLAEEIMVLCLLSKSRHFTMAVRVVLVSSMYPTQSILKTASYILNFRI